MAYINGVNQEQIKKQQLKKENAKATKPEAKDIKLFGNLTTGAKVEKQSQAAQQAQISSVFSNPTKGTSPKESGISVFGSLTAQRATGKKNVNAEQALTAANMQIFSQNNAQPKMEEIVADRNLKSEIAATNEALQAENSGNVGSRFDTAAPEKEVIISMGNGIGNTNTVLSKTDVSVTNNNTYYVNKHSRRNVLLDMYANTHSLQRQVNNDFNDIMSINPKWGNGCCDPKTNTNCTCEGEDEAKSKKTKHHTKHDSKKRLITNVAVGAAGLAVGGVIGYAWANSGTKSEKVSTSKTQATSEKAAAEVKQNEAATSSLIKEMKDATPENYVSVMEKAEKQYADNETGLANIENSICEQQATIAQNEQEKQDNNAQIESNNQMLQDLENEQTDWNSKKTAYEKSAQEKRSQAQTLVSQINTAANEVQTTTQAVTELRGKMSAGNLSGAERGNLQTQLTQAETAQQEAVRQHAQLTKQKEDLETAAKDDAQKAKDCEAISKETNNKAAKITEIKEKYEQANKVLDTRTVALQQSTQTAQTETQKLKEQQTKLQQAQAELYQQAQLTAEKNTDDKVKGYKFDTQAGANRVNTDFAGKYRPN